MSEKTKFSATFEETAFSIGDGEKRTGQYFGENDAISIITCRKTHGFG